MRDACRTCGHPSKDHCKGGVPHSSHKEAQAMSGLGAVICVGRHCNQPICSCTEFVKGEEDATNQ